MSTFPFSGQRRRGGSRTWSRGVSCRETPSVPRRAATPVDPVPGIWKGTCPPTPFRGLEVRLLTVRVLGVVPRVEGSEGQSGGGVGPESAGASPVRPEQDRSPSPAPSPLFWGHPGGSGRVRRADGHPNPSRGLVRTGVSAATTLHNKNKEGFGTV